MLLHIRIATGWGLGLWCERKGLSGKKVEKPAARGVAFLMQEVRTRKLSERGSALKLQNRSWIMSKCYRISGAGRL